MDAMQPDDSHEVDHLASCGCDDTGATFDPSGELAPPPPPVDIDVQPQSPYDVMGVGQPGAPEYTPEPTPPPAPLADLPVDDCALPPPPAEWQAPDTSVEAAPPVPTFAVEGEGSFDVTGLGQPGHPDVAPDTSIDVIGLGQPGNEGPVDTAAPEAIDVIGLGQPGNEGPVDTAAPDAIEVIGLGQPGNPVVDAPTVGFVGGSAPLEMTIVPGDGSTHVNEQSAGLGVIGGGPDNPLAEALAKGGKPIDEVTLAVLMESQRTMNEIWTSDNSSSS
jgi:hypothetical protein